MRPRIATTAAAVLAALLMGAAPAAATAQPQIVVDPAQRLGAISPYVFGTNHRYGYHGFGMFDPQANAVFPKFVDQSRAAGFTIVRYPGGSIANPYHWQRAIGPRSQRTPNWGSGDPQDDAFGADEFGRYMEQIGAAGDFVVNFATGDAREAADWVEYMTAPVGQNPNGGTDWAAVRAANGHPAPYDIPYWEVGNELYAPKFWMAGDSDTECPVHRDVCLYAFGGSTRFTNQRVIGYADWTDSAAVSDGSPNQVFYANYPPVQPGSQTVYVDGTAWRQVDDLASAGAENVYTLEPKTGKIAFGDGTHGNIPRQGAVVTISYTSGPHDGFVDFYRAMKAVNPHIKVCSSSRPEGFTEVMGASHPYDCMVKHTYVRNPGGANQPPDEYHSHLMLNADDQGRAVAQVQDYVRQNAGRRAGDVGVVVTEYGQLKNSGPKGVDLYMQSLDQGLHTANQLRNWIDLGIPLADVQALTDFVFGPPPNGQPTATGVRTAIAGPGPDSVSQGVAHVLDLFTHMTGDTHVASDVLEDPQRVLSDGQRMDELETVASTDAAGDVYLTVINNDPSDDVTATVLPRGYWHDGRASAWTVDAPSFLSYNTPDDPDVVTLTKAQRTVGAGAFEYTFPAHSVTAIRLTGRVMDRHLSLALSASNGFVEPGGRLELTATVTNDGDDDAAGTVEPVVPAGWAITPASARYAVGPHSQERLRFTVTVPQDAHERQYDLGAVLYGPDAFVADTAQTSVIVRELGSWTPLFSDGFDDQPVGAAPIGWAIDAPAGAFTVQPDPAGSGKALRVRKADPSEGQITAEHSFEPVSGRFRFAIRVRAEQTDAALGIQLLDGGGTAVQKLSLTTDGDLAYTDGADFVRGATYDSGRWYRLEVIGDPATGRYKLYVDDILVAQPHLNAAAGPPTTVRVQMPGNPSTRGTFYVDDVSVSRPAS